MTFILLLGAFVIQTASSAEPLDLPSRPATAPGGAAFAQSITDLPLKEREERVLDALLAGNLPDFLRTLTPVRVSRENDAITYFVTPDYLAVGSNEDYFLVPLTPRTAQRIADRLDCSLPTTRMVDDVYRSATVKLTPSPIPPSPTMTTVPVFLRHSEIARAQSGDEPLGALVAGHKKDVVITNRIVESPDKVAIYGWHQPDGRPIQPLYLGHDASWVDYSHGIRLVHRRVIVNGVPTRLDAVLADPRLAPLLSGEGVMRRPRYAIDQGETVDEFHLEDGVRVVINAPEGESARPILLALYALPNGATIEQTIGKRVRAGDDGRYDVQHIGAQTRFLRERVADRRLVVAYLETDLRSWPAWRKQHGDAGIPALLDKIRGRLDGGGDARIVWTGHSGGGSLAFGYLNAVATIPDDVERIAFLDSNYAYETERHRDKLTRWLKASDAHYLSVLAYNDAVARLNGKPFVSESGGTWGRSRLMLHDLEESIAFSRQDADGLQRFRALDGRVTFLLRENPERKILHTVQVERNGFIEGLLSGTPLEGDGYAYLGRRAYERFIRSE